MTAQLSKESESECACGRPAYRMKWNTGVCRVCDRLEQPEVMAEIRKAVVGHGRDYGAVYELVGM